jgi:hypothetical protein
VRTFEEIKGGQAGEIGLSFGAPKRHTSNGNSLLLLAFETGLRFGRPK